MPDVLRVKRRPVGGAAGPPAALAAAEIAFNEQDNVLYYGGGNSGGAATSIFSIGGPGAFARLAGGTFTGAVTFSSTLTANGTVSGTGITALLASPPAIGGTAAAAGKFTTLTATGASTLAGITMSAATDITLARDPTANLQAVTKQYVDQRTPFLTVAAYGAVGDGVTDDTTAINNAIAAGASAGVAVWLFGRVGNAFKVTAPINITTGVQLCGEGQSTNEMGTAGEAQGSVFITTTNFSAVIHVTATAVNWRLQDFTVYTSGTTTQALHIDINSTLTQFAHVVRCQFIGNLAGTLVYSSGILIEFRDCGFYASASTFMLQFDGNNENSSVVGCWFMGGACNVMVSNNSGQIACQGIRIFNNAMFNPGGGSGSANIIINSAASYIFIDDNSMDLTNQTVVALSNACTYIHIRNNYLGSNNPTVAVGISIDQSCSEIFIEHNAFGNQNYNIIIGATTGARSTGVRIHGNDFATANTCAMSLDSVNNCSITDNLDTGPHASFQILRTNAAGGAYDFGGNSWSPVAPPAFDTASNYNAMSKDRGVTLFNYGTQQLTGVASQAINHGLVAAPTSVHVTLQNASAYTSYNVSGFTATTFTINLSVAGTYLVNWQARV